jgi:hypothetical protein
LDVLWILLREQLPDLPDSHIEHGTTSLGTHPQARGKARGGVGPPPLKVGPVVALFADVEAPD